MLTMTADTIRHIVGDLLPMVREPPMTPDAGLIHGQADASLIRGDQAHDGLP
jgi:hypothetical protein